MDDVYIRPLCVDDAKISYHWRNDPEIWRYTGSRPNALVTQDIERAWAERVISDSTRANFAICTRCEDRYIGNIYLVNLQSGVGELGIFIGDKSYWGKGFGSQALEQLKDIAWNELGLQKIVIDVAVDNHAAYRTYMKCGATIEDRKHTDAGRIYLSICRGGAV